MSVGKNISQVLIRKLGSQESSMSHRNNYRIEDVYSKINNDNVKHTQEISKRTRGRLLMTSLKIRDF